MALEIERKYLIRMPDADALSRMPGCESWNIEQTYLADGVKHLTRRIRRIESGGRERCFYTEKRKVSALCAEEAEREISRETYDRLRAQADPTLRTIFKRRLRIPYAGQLLEIDLYSFWTDRATLEIELEREAQAVTLPDWLSPVRDVSGEKAYKNRHLAKRVPMEPLD